MRLLHSGRYEGTVVQPARELLPRQPAPEPIPRPSPSYLPVLLVVALALRVWGIGYGLPWLNRYFFETDEGAIINLAMAFGSGDLNPHSFNNPPLFMYLLFGLYGLFFVAGRLIGLFGGAADFAAFYFSHLTPFYLLGRGLSAALGVASVYLAYRLGCRLYGPRVGTLGALFLTVAPLHVDLSHQVKVDVAAVFFMLLALASGARLLASGVSTRRGRLACLLAGTCAGLAAATKYQDGFVALSLVVAIVAPCLRARLRAAQIARDPSPATHHPSPVLSSLISHLTLLTTAAAVGFTIGNPFGVANPGLFLRSLAGLSEEVSLTSRAHAWNWLPPHLLDLSDPNVLGLPLLALLLAGLGHALWRRTAADLFLAATPLGLYPFLSLPAYAHSRERFLLPLLPPLCLLGARALVALSAGLPRVVPLLLASVAMAPALAADVQHDVLASHKTTTVLAREWIERHVPAGSAVLMDPKQVPQLTFTPQALQRRLAIHDIPRRSLLLPSRREVLETDPGTRGRLAALKDRALTSDGVPYDLYLLLNADEQVLQPEQDYYALGIDTLRQRYGIRYVVLSAASFEYFLADPPLDDRGTHPVARAFYESIFIRWRPMLDLSPNAFTRPGPRILVYRLDD